MSKRAAAKVCDDGHHVKVEELVHSMDRGYVGSPSLGGIVGLSKLSVSLSTKVEAMVGEGRTNEQQTILR